MKNLHCCTYRYISTEMNKTTTTKHREYLKYNWSSEEDMLVSIFLHTIFLIRFVFAPTSVSVYESVWVICTCDVLSNLVSSFFGMLLVFPTRFLAAELNEILRYWFLEKRCLLDRERETGREREEERKSKNEKNKFIRFDHSIGSCSVVYVLYIIYEYVPRICRKYERICYLFPNFLFNISRVLFCSVSFALLLFIYFALSHSPSCLLPLYFYIHNTKLSWIFVRQC